MFHVCDVTTGMVVESFSARADAVRKAAQREKDWLVCSDSHRTALGFRIPGDGPSHQDDFVNDMA